MSPDDSPRPEVRGALSLADRHLRAAAGPGPRRDKHRDKAQQHQQRAARYAARGGHQP